MPSKQSFNGTEHCGLCRLKFPRRSEDSVGAWQYAFRAVVCVDGNNDNRVRITSSAHLPDINYDIDVTLYGGLRTRTVTIRRSTRVNVEDPSNGQAFCFHDWCYTVLVWTLGDCPKSNIYNTIYKLVRTLEPDASQWETVYESRHQSDSASSLQILHVLEGSLQKPLISSKLPPEIRLLIWGYVGSMTPYSTFVTIVGETSRLSYHLRYSSSCNLLLERGSFISLKTITVFGTEYIQDLVNAGHQQGNTKVSGDVTEVKFVAGLGGICAIKLLGDGWKTSWIGKVPHTGQRWYGTIQGIVPRVLCSYNDLNCSDITSSWPCSTNRIVWDRPKFPYLLTDPDMALSLDRPRTDIPALQFFRYVPLYRNKEYIRGLTVYLTGNGMVGFESQFARKSELSGCRDGCALYFPLYPRERIAYAWLRVVNFPSVVFAAPALIIQTTLGRMQCFGSFIRPRLVEKMAYNWIFLGNRRSVSAFYYKNLSSGSVILKLATTNNGASVTTTPLTPYYYVCDFPAIASPNAGLFLSVAVLSDLQKVHMCRVGNRCTGILMHYNSGLDLVLGQWHVSSVSQHSCIYDSLAEYTADICFRTTAVKRHKIVTDITFVEKKGKRLTPDPECQVFSSGTQISWWFSEFYDAILPWTGEIHDIPEESKRSVE